MPLDIAESKSDSIIYLTLEGTLEIGSDTERLTQTVREHLDAGDNQFLLDLAGVKYIDSTGMSVLVQIYSAAKEASGAVKLLRLTQRVHDVLQITRLSSVFEIYNDPTKAIASFQKLQAEGSGERKNS